MFTVRITHRVPGTRVTNSIINSTTVGNFSSVHLVNNTRSTKNRRKSSLDVLNKQDIFIDGKTIEKYKCLLFFVLRDDWRGRDNFS